MARAFTGEHVLGLHCSHIMKRRRCSTSPLHACRRCTASCLPASRPTRFQKETKRGKNRGEGSPPWCQENDVAGI